MNGEYKEPWEKILHFEMILEAPSFDCRTEGLSIGCVRWRCPARALAARKGHPGFSTESVQGKPSLPTLETRPRFCVRFKGEGLGGEPPPPPRASEAPLTRAACGAYSIKR